MGDNNFLQQNWPCLVKNLRSPLIHGILDEMFSELNLSQDEYDHVYSCKETDCDKARRLLQLVSSRGEPALRVFKETLKEHNPELYESLGETDGDDSLPGTLEKALFSSGHDSDDSGSSGVECGSPASLGTPSDEEEDGRSAEPLRVTVGAVNEMMEELEKKGTELRLKSRMRQAKQTFNDLAQLADLCAKQEEGEVGFQIKYLKRKSVLEAFQSSYDQGTLGEEVQEQFAKLVEENPDILKVETDVKVVWKEEQNKNRDKEQAKGYDGIIKVSAKELKLADDYVLEVGSQGAFESLCDYLVENPDELDQIITYLNKIKVQVYDITRGCIELQFGCLTGESAVCLQEEDSSGRLSTQFQELMSPFLKQFGLKSLVLDVRCTFSQDTKAETSPEQIAAAQPAVYPLTVAQTTSYTAISKPPATDSLQTDTASPGISEDSVMQEECFASDTTLSKVSNTKGLDHANSVDNLMALPPPIRHADYSGLRGLDLAIVGGKDLSCTDAAYNASTLNFTVRQVQTALRLRSKKAWLQQKDVLKTAREDTEAMVHHLSKEIKGLTEKDECAQKVLLEHKQETQQVKEMNKTYEANIEVLTAEITKLSNKIPSLQDQVITKGAEIEKLLAEKSQLSNQLSKLQDKVKSLSEKDKISQKVLSEKNIEIQQLQDTSKTKEAEIEKPTAENTKLSSQLPNLQGKHQERALSKEKEDSRTIYNSAPCGVTESTITIKWAETVEGVDSYIISIDPAYCDNPAARARVDVGAPFQYMFTGLTPGALYNTSVTTVRGGVQRMEATWAQRTKPAKPGDMHIRDVRERGMTVTWAGSEGKTDSYRVRISPVDFDTFDQECLTLRDCCSHTFTHLTPGTEYNIGVRAVSGQLMSQEVIMHQRTSPVPSDVINVVNITENNISITWKKAAGAKDSYRISITPPDGDNPAASVNHGDPLGYNFTGLTSGTQYNISVTTVSGEMKSVARTRNLCTAPAPLDKIRITWDDAAGDKDGYLLSYCPIDGSNPTRTFRAGDFTNLVPGRRYTVSIQTVSGKGKSVTRHQRTTQDNDLDLWIAAQKGHISQVEMLLSEGANVNIADKDGRTPLWTAVQQGHLPTVEMLLSKGADVNMADKGGRSPIDVAKREAHSAVEEILMKHKRRQASADLTEGVSTMTAKDLRRHNKEVVERRQFRCALCDSTWWKRVFQHKPMSTCDKCQVKYDPIPKDLEYGIGKFTCQHCGNTFTGWAQYNKPAECHNCNNVQVFPTEGSIGPRQSGPPMRTRNVHSCAMCDYGRVHPCPSYKKVLVASTPHISTGSTVSTFLTQASDLEA